MFSAAGDYLETDRGVIDVGIFSACIDTQDIQYIHYVTEEWLLSNSESILWIPQAHRASCVAVVRDVVIMGHASGAISFIQV